MVIYWHTITLGVVMVVSFLYLNCMDRKTRLGLRLGFVFTAGGAFGEIASWYGPWRAIDSPWVWLPACILHTGLALVAIELARGHTVELFHALQQRLGHVSWDGRERRQSGD